MSFGDAIHREGFGPRGGARGAGRSDDSGPAASEFSSQANLARSNVQQLLTNINTITRLSSALGGPKDTVELRERLHRIIEETKLLGVDTKSVIKDLNQIANGSYQGGGTGNGRHKLEARKLSDDFQRSLQRYQEVVRTTLQKERESVAKAKRETGDLDDEGGERSGLLEREREREKREELIQVDQELHFTEALIHEREQGIKDIERSVHDVNEIFRDLAVLISDQGNALDDIESGIVNTQQQSETAASELKKAAANQKRARRTMFCLVTVLLLVGILVVLIITKAI